MLGNSDSYIVHALVAGIVTSHTTNLILLSGKRHSWLDGFDDYLGGYNMIQLMHRHHIPEGSHMAVIDLFRILQVLLVVDNLLVHATRELAETKLHGF